MFLIRMFTTLQVTISALVLMFENVRCQFEEFPSFFNEFPSSIKAARDPRQDRGK